MLSFDILHAIAKLTELLIALLLTVIVLTSLLFQLL